MNFIAVLWKKTLHTTNVVDLVLLMAVFSDLGLCYDGIIRLISEV